MTAAEKAEREKAEYEKEFAAFRKQIDADPLRPLYERLFNLAEIINHRIDSGEMQDHPKRTDASFCAAEGGLALNLLKARKLLGGKNPGDDYDPLSASNGPSASGDDAGAAASLLGYVEEE